MTHESNGIDIITALILNDISPLCKYRMDLVLQLKVGRASGPRLCASLHGHPSARASPRQDNASKLLLALMESRHDSENAERILISLRPQELVRADSETPPGCSPLPELFSLQVLVRFLVCSQ